MASRWRERRRNRAKGQGRIAQIRAAYTMTRKADPKVGLYSFGAWALVFAVFLGIGFLVGHPVYLGFFGFMAGFLAWSIVFGRRAENAAYARIEGQPGASASVLASLRRGWSEPEAVQVNRNADLVHRTVGRPGIVLVAEGPSGRAGQLLAQEKKRLARLVPDVPVHAFQVGKGEGQLTLSKLRRTVMRLPRTLTSSQAAETQRRLKAMPSLHVPLPKGPLPRGQKLPRGGPQMR